MCITLTEGHDGKADLFVQDQISYLTLGIFFYYHLFMRATSALGFLLV